MRDADPRQLGVHAAITVPGVPDEILPEYVLRDVDDAEFGVRARVAAASQRGGFVLLVGGSSVGKSRTAFEAVTALLPDWWLVHPDGPAGVAALAAAPHRRIVVWLDELERYMESARGLTGAVVRALLHAHRPAVIIGTLWPDLYTAYSRLPLPRGADPHAREREVLDLATVVRIGPDFSLAEQDQARAAAGRDARLRVALDVRGYGLTQTLAGAPQLVARWEDARSASPYAWAVLTAALDVVRLGARAPLSCDLLRNAAVGYCTSRQRAEAPENWFELAVTYSTGKLHGAASPLSPVGADMSQVAGYTVADYLIQHAGLERRDARIPASTWDAILSHHNPADCMRLADSASSRLLYRYAFSLYQQAADEYDDWDAAWELADLLARRGDLDGLRARVDIGDGVAAAWLLSDILDRDGYPGEARRILTARSDPDDSAAAGRLDRLLARRGDVDGLRDRAEDGDSTAAVYLARLLGRSGDVDALRRRANRDAYAGDQLFALLAQRGDVDALLDLLGNGYGGAARWLAGLLAERGELDDAAELISLSTRGWGRAAAEQLVNAVKHGDLDGLRAQADGRLRFAAWVLAGLLAARGDVEELRARADADDKDCAERLAWLLAEQGDIDALRARADAGDSYSADQLVRLLAERGDVDELRARAEAGDSDSAEQLVSVLVEHGQTEEGEWLLRFGLNPDGSVASP